MANGLKKAWYNYKRRTYYDCDIYHNNIFIKNHVELDNGQSIIKVPKIGYFEVPNRENPAFRKKNGRVVMLDAENATPYEIMIQKAVKTPLPGEVHQVCLSGEENKEEIENLANIEEEKPKPKKRITKAIKEKIKKKEESNFDLSLVQQLDYIVFKEKTLSPEVFKENIEADTVADLQHGETTFMEALAPQLPSIIFGIVAIVALWIGANALGVF